MKKQTACYLGIAAVLLILTGAFCGAAAAEDTAFFGPVENSAYVPDSILVKYDPVPGELPEDYLNPQYAAGIIKQYTLVPGLYAIKLADGVNADEACAFFSGLPGVSYAEPNCRISLSGGYTASQMISESEISGEEDSSAASSAPNDEYYPKQWGLNSPTAGISAEAAWEFEKEHREETAEDIVIAVIDSGVDYTHPDLKNRMWVNSDEIPDNGIDDDENGYIDDYYGWHFPYNSPDPHDYVGHGTSCAGIAAAETNNRIGIAGTAGTTPNVKIMAVGVFDAEESATVGDLISGIEYAVENGADILNISWGGASDFNPFEEAMQKAEENGVLVVCSAGSGSRDTDVIPEYPASTEGDYVVAVASSGQDNKKMDFSNWGKTSVDIAVPGMNNISTYPSFKFTTLSSYNLSRTSQYPIQFAVGSIESTIPDDYRKYTKDSLELKYTGPDGEWIPVTYRVLMGKILPEQPADGKTINSADVTFAMHNGTFQLWAYSDERKGPYYAFAIHHHQTEGTISETVEPVTIPYNAIAEALGVPAADTQIIIYFEPKAADGYLIVKNVSFVNKKLQSEEHSYTDTYGIEAPVIAGAAALLLSVEPDLTPKEIRTILIDTADKNEKWGWKDLTVSEGRLNMEKAVKAAHPVITFMKNSGTEENTKVGYHYGHYAPFPSAIVLVDRAGYEFIRWDTSPDGTGTSYADRDVIPEIKSPLTLYAQWKVHSEKRNVQEGGIIPDIDMMLSVEEKEGAAEKISSVELRSASGLKDGTKLVVTADGNPEIKKTIITPSGYTKQQPLSFFEIDAEKNAEGAKFDIAVTLKSRSDKNKVHFMAWGNDKTNGWSATYLPAEVIKEDENTVVYRVTADVSSTFAIVLSEPKKKSSSKQKGTSIWLTATPTPTPTVTPTQVPTAEPTVTPEVPTVKPVTQPTQAKSPAPFIGVLAGLGAAAAVFGLRRR